MDKVQALCDYAYNESLWKCADKSDKKEESSVANKENRPTEKRGLGKYYIKSLVCYKSCIFISGRRNLWLWLDDEALHFP